MTGIWVMACFIFFLIACFTALWSVVKRLSRETEKTAFVYEFVSNLIVVVCTYSGILAVQKAALIEALAGRGDATYLSALPWLVLAAVLTIAGILLHASTYPYMYGRREIPKAPENKKQAAGDVYSKFHYIVLAPPNPITQYCDKLRAGVTEKHKDDMKSISAQFVKIPGEKPRYNIEADEIPEVVETPETINKTMP